MRRRSFLLGSLAATVGVAGAGAYWRRDDLAERFADDSTRRYGDVELPRGEARADAPNVLLLTIDDLNDWLGFLNDHPGTHTPNLDALAAESLVFTHAYTPAPICLAARSAVMFGRLPHRSGVYDHSDESRRRYEQVRAASSFVDDLWAAGYETVGAGKVFHGSERRRWSEYRPTRYWVPGAQRGDPALEGQFDPDWRSPYDGQPIGRGEGFTGEMLDFGPSGRAPAEEPDGQATEWIRGHLADASARPFLLALGLVLPHEPWRLPQRYFDLHPIEDVQVPELYPDDLDDLGSHARDLVERNRIFALMQESGIWEEAVQAYQAAISFVDDRIGLVLDDLASRPFADETIVALWSDQGHHLGEKMHLSKFTLWERATHVPLLFRVPGRFDTGRRIEAPVSTVDLVPTLADLTGIELSAGHDGASLLPLVDAPDLADARPPLTTWRAGNHAVRRGPWRYIRYQTGETELYDHREDPDERVNLAGDATHAETAAMLDAYLPDA